MSEKKVIAIDGNEYPRTNCRKINDMYYLIADPKTKDSGHCVIINNVAYRINNKDSKVGWDDYKKEYVLKQDLRTVYCFDTKTVYTTSVYHPVSFIKNGESLYALTEKQYNSNTVFNPFRNTYVIDSPANIIKAIRDHGAFRLRYSRFPTDIYNAGQHPAFEEMQKALKSYPRHSLDAFFKNYTFGVEIETSSGGLPETFLQQESILPLKDGSITGHEYVTVVLPSTGLTNRLSNYFDNIGKTCITNQFCSLHYHIGGVRQELLKRNISIRKFIVAFWELYARLQDELDTMMPPYKRQVEFFRTKSDIKDHCQRIPRFDLYLKDTDRYFETIVSHFAAGGQVKALDKTKDTYVHPFEGRNKWEMSSRYYSINLIPFFFENKETIEFRLHSGTVNKYKAINWLLICLAIIEYAIDNADTIIQNKTKITLADVINNFDSSETISDYLNDYILSRKNDSLKTYLNDRQYYIGNEFVEDNFYKLKSPY